MRLHCHYITHIPLAEICGPMETLKTETMSLRVSPQFKAALKRAAERERRSQTNLLEHLVYAYCEQNGIPVKLASLNKKLKSQE